MSKLLVVDDEPNILFTLTETLSTPDLQVLTATTGREGIDAARQHRPDVVLLDVRLPDMSGLEAFEKMHDFDSRVPVIIMTAFAKTDTAIEAMRRGAFEYLTKPVDLSALRQTIRRAIEVSRLSHVPAVVQGETDDDSNAAVDTIVGQSAAMQEVYKAIGRIAPQDATVLILGESGTGKELVARAVYHYSRRNGKPFLAINCAALSESLLESELFGHERGAFTGADQRRIGKFEQVNGGTIFLDEIGDMSSATQAKALRLLQQQEFERVGGNTTIRTDVRIIAATNKDLGVLVDNNLFRQDLFYRLNGFTIRLPPLRERMDDIPMLTDHFVKAFNRELRKNVHAVTSDVRTALAGYHWPGNIRELASTIRFAMVHAATEVLTVDCLPESLRDASIHRSLSPTPGEAKDIAISRNSGGTLDILSLTQRLLAEGESNLYRSIIAEVDRIVLGETMRFFSGNQQQAAARLGLSRMTLRSKLRSIRDEDEHEHEHDETDKGELDIE